MSFSIFIFIFCARDLLTVQHSKPAHDKHLKLLVHNAIKLTKKFIRNKRQNGEISKRINMFANNALDKRCGIKQQSMFDYIVEQLCLMTKAPNSQASINDVAQAIIFNASLVAVPGLNRPSYIEINRQLATIKASLTIIEKSNELLIHLFAVDNNKQSEHTLVAIENQKKPSNFVLTATELETSQSVLKPTTIQPTLKLDQVSNLATKLQQYVLEQQIKPVGRDRLAHHLRFNAPAYFPELKQKIETAPVSRILQLATDQAFAGRLIDEANATSSSPLSLSSAVSRIGVERIPNVLMRQHLLQVLEKQMSQSGGFFYHKISELLKTQSYVSRLLPLSTRSDFEVVSCVMLMALFIHDGNVNYLPSQFIRRWHTADPTFTSLFNFQSKTEVKKIIGQLSLNWRLSKLQHEQILQLLEHNCGDKPLRLIPTKNHVLLYASQLMVLLFKINNGFISSTELGHQLDEINNKLGLESFNLVAEKCLDEVQPFTRFC